MKVVRPLNVAVAPSWASRLPLVRLAIWLTEAVPPIVRAVLSSDVRCRYSGLAPLSDSNAAPVLVALNVVNAEKSSELPEFSPRNQTAPL